jgi:hypothetical protein
MAPAAARRGRGARPPASPRTRAATGSSRPAWRTPAAGPDGGASPGEGSRPHRSRWACGCPRPARPAWERLRRRIVAWRPRPAHGRAPRAGSSTPRHAGPGHRAAARPTRAQRRPVRGPARDGSPRPPASGAAQRVGEDRARPPPGCAARAGRAQPPTSPSARRARRNLRSPWPSRRSTGSSRAIRPLPRPSQQAAKAKRRSTTRFSVRRGPVRALACNGGPKQGR